MDQKEFIPYRVPWSEIKRVSKGELGSAAKIKEICEKLMSRKISIKSGKVISGFSFLAEWKVHPGEFVEFQIAPGMKDLLLDLLNKGNFTLYQLECVLALPSRHAVRMYEVLKSYAWRKQPVIIKLEDLKQSLDIADKETYADYGHFRIHILEKAKKNLAKYCDIKFSYKPLKRGRKVVAVEFNIRSNKKYQRSILAEVARKHVLPGDIVLINGEQCLVDSSACYYQKQSYPIGQLSEMLKSGQIEIVQEADKK